MKLRAGQGQGQEGETAEARADEEVQGEVESSLEQTPIERVNPSFEPTLKVKENSISSPNPTSSITSTPMVPTSVILSQMPQTEELTLLAHEHLERFKSQMALLRRNGVMTSRNVFIHEDLKEIIPFKLKQTGVADGNLWESWTDE